MPKGNTFINDLLALFFNGTAIADLAENDATSPLTDLYLSLHTAYPGAAGNQTTSEASYVGYAREAVSRDNTGFTVSGQSVTLAAAVSFPQAPTDATDVLMFWAVGTASSGTGKILYTGPIGSNLGAGTGATDDNITIPGLSGVAVNDRITFIVPTGGTIPTGITAGTVYYVISVTGDVITISATEGGSAVDITAAGQLLAFKVTPITTGGGILVTPQLTTGTTIIEL